MTYLLYILGFLPSFIWLLFYLRKDKHPEPNRMVLKVFIFGIISAFFTIFAQVLLKESLNVFNLPLKLALILNVFIGAGIIEETAKYCAAKFGVFRDKELDEPTDIILYMIIAALGFAALENILYLSQQVLNKESLAVLSEYGALMPAKATLEFLAWRFISATFLHALAAGLFGFFIALSFHYAKFRKLFWLAGLLIASFLHGLYDWFLLTSEGKTGITPLLPPILILVVLSCFVGYAFRKLKKMQSTCL